MVNTDNSIAATISPTAICRMPLRSRPIVEHEAKRQNKLHLNFLFNANLCSENRPRLNSRCATCSAFCEKTMQAPGVHWT